MVRVLAAGVIATALTTAVLAASSAGGTGTCGAVFTWKNGHRYQAVCKKNVTWPQAVAAARKAGAHLVTLSSAAENSFVFAHVRFPAIWRPNGQGQSAGPWIGLLQSPGAAEPAGGWHWITNERLGYADWAPNEPDNYQIQENGADYWDDGSGAKGAWNDIARAPKLGYVNGYVLEWDHPKKTT